MAVEASNVKEIVDDLLKECGFISSLHCEKAGHHWDQQLGPDPMVKAVITGFVYLGQIVDKRLATLIEADKGERPYEKPSPGFRD